MIKQLPKKIVIRLINVYQFLLSPDHSWLKARFPHGYCRFYPSCSEYAKQSVERFGVFKGLSLGLIRLVKCHPWAEPKVDPVPHL
jgi:putative membrane protein insertion efficiency factor